MSERSNSPPALDTLEVMSKPPAVDAPIVDWPSDAGRRIRLPRSRRMVNDLLYFSRDVPAHSVVRECQISDVVRARDALKSECGLRISWPILFTKAFAWVAIQHSPLRSLFMKWPFGHLYEHPYNVSRMTVLREVKGEDWVFFFRLIQPENQSLLVLQQQLDEIKTEREREGGGGNTYTKAIIEGIEDCLKSDDR